MSILAEYTLKLMKSVAELKDLHDVVLISGIDKLK